MTEDWKPPILNSILGTENEMLHSNNKTFTTSVVVKTEIPDEISNEIQVPLNIQSHIKEEFGISNYKCDHCDKVFNNINELELHVKLHKFCTIQNDFKCENCDKSFSQQCILQKHIDFFHNKSYEINEYDQMYKCFVLLERLQKSEIEKWKSIDTWFAITNDFVISCVFKYLHIVRLLSRDFYRIRRGAEGEFN